MPALRVDNQATALFAKDLNQAREDTKKLQAEVRQILGADVGDLHPYLASVSTGVS